MYGKFFASTFTGSMMGSGANVFAVWGYVIANTVKAHIELNPRYLSAVIGMPVDEVVKAIDALCSPDPHSRSKDESGCRLVRDGEYQYRVVNHLRYRNIVDEDQRREYLRIKQQECRDRKKAGQPMSNGLSTPVNMSNDVTHMSTHTEAEAEAEEERKDRCFSLESLCTTSSKPRTRTKEKSPKNRPTKTCPKDFAVTDSLRQWANENFPAVDVDAQTDTMKDYTFSRAISDWDGAWRNWIRKASEYGKTQHVAHERRASNGHQYQPRDREADILEAERILGFDTQHSQPFANPRTIDA